MATPEQAYEAVRSLSAYERLRVVERVIRELAEQTDSLEERFARLVSEWHSQSEFLSSSTAITALPAYRMIVSLGRDAVPLLLKEMRDRPDHWSAALHEITGATPWSDADSGDIHRLAAAWLAWGKKHGLIE
jgi:hypothetical protein